MYYVGRLKTNNKQFDACQSGKPFKFKVGGGDVIKVKSYSKRQPHE
jgi:FK506-binding nuclear protein